MVNYSEQCNHCICRLCEDYGCAECAMCKGIMKTDRCQYSIITKKTTKKKRRSNYEKFKDKFEQNEDSLSDKQFNRLQKARLHEVRLAQWKRERRKRNQK